MKRSLTRKKVLGSRVGLMLGPALLLATAAFADTAGQGGSGGLSPLMLTFLIFVAVIVGIQLIPAIVIFGSLIAAVFKRSKKATDTATINEQV